jgi:hypothetical protein
MQTMHIVPSNVHSCINMKVKEINKGGQIDHMPFRVLTILIWMRSPKGWWYKLVSVFFFHNFLVGFFKKKGVD